MRSDIKKRKERDYMMNKFDKKGANQIFQNSLRTDA
jgi:hypothetical protein